MADPKPQIKKVDRIQSRSPPQIYTWAYHGQTAENPKPRTNLERSQIKNDA